MWHLTSTGGLVSLSRASKTDEKTLAFRKPPSRAVCREKILGKLVVIVEDEPNIAESLSFILGRAGFEIVCVDDGNDAIFEIKTRHPSLVILDVMLPNRSGLEILRDIRAAPGIASTPVLMLSAKGQTKDKDIAVESGADHYMVKPFSNREVVDQVTRLAGG